MAYLIERKSQTIFVTATSIIARGKPREMVIESRPEYAVIHLAGIPESFPCPGRKCTQRPSGGMNRISESKVRRSRSGKSDAKKRLAVGGLPIDPLTSSRA